MWAGVISSSAIGGTATASVMYVQSMLGVLGTREVCVSVSRLHVGSRVHCLCE